MKEIISLLIPAFSLYCYMILSSIEFGVSFFRLFPGILKKDDSAKTYVSPVWETTNVFLVFFIVSLVAFFPGANFRFGTDLLLVLFSALAFFGLRIVGMLLIFYGNVRSHLIDLLFFIGSFGAPMTLSLFFIYVLSGAWAPFVIHPLYLGLCGVVASSIIFISGTFFRFFGKEIGNERLNRTIKNSFYVLLLSVTFFLYFLNDSAHYLFVTPLSRTVLLASLLVPALLFVISEYFLRPALSFVASALLIAGIFFSLLFLHLPFLIFPYATIYTTYADSRVAMLLFVATGVGMFFVLPALFLLYRLFVFSPRRG